MKKQRKILNTFDTLYDVRKIDPNNLLLRFVDHYLDPGYEICDITVTSNDVTKEFNKLHSYISERLVLEVENPGSITVWQGELGWEYDWGTDYSLRYESFQVETHQKSTEDWIEHVNKLREEYNKLYRKRSFTVREFRSRIIDEIVGELESKMKMNDNRLKGLDPEDINRMMDFIRGMKNIHPSGIIEKFIIDRNDNDPKLW